MKGNAVPESNPGSSDGLVSCEFQFGSQQKRRLVNDGGGVAIIRRCLFSHLLIVSQPVIHKVFLKVRLIYFSKSQALPAVHFYGLLRKSGHVHPNRRRSLTAMKINPIRELWERGTLGSGNLTSFLDI